MQNKNRYGDQSLQILFFVYFICLMSFKFLSYLLLKSYIFRKNSRYSACVRQCGVPKPTSGGSAESALLILSNVVRPRLKHFEKFIGSHSTLQPYPPFNNVSTNNILRCCRFRCKVSKLCKVQRELQVPACSPYT